MREPEDNCSKVLLNAEDVSVSSFSAASDDVLGHLVHEGHGALQSGPDHGVERVQVDANQGADFLQ